LTFDFNENLSESATTIDLNESKGLKLKHINLMTELNEAENLNITKAMQWIKRNRKSNPLSITFLMKLHKQMFGDVWKWAGVFRVSDKNIGVPWPEIPSKIKNLIDDTHFWIQNKSFDWDEIGVRFHHRLVSIHPFVNGNGRHARLLCDILLERYNVKIFSWGGVTTRSDETRSFYIKALQAADQKNYDLLTSFVRS